MITYLSDEGHTVVTENIKTHAARLVLDEGYRLFHNANRVGGIELVGEPINPVDVTDDMNLAAIRWVVGG